MKASFVAVCFATSLLFSFVLSLSTKKVHVSYPAELLLPVTGSSFQANVTQDKLLCFGNRDYSTPTYIETLFCMLPYFPGTSKYCNSVWGSRTVEVEASGSIEFLRVSKLPHETSSTILHGDHLDSSYALELSASRWLEMDSNRQFDMKSVKKTLQIPAEPLYLCARSTDWQGAPSSFQMKFRPARLRGRDKRRSNDQTLMHIMLIMGVSSAWLIPYLAALFAAVLAYEHAIKVMLTLFMVSTSVVCLTPVMLTKNNRTSARLYFNYFFTRTQALETRTQIKKRLPVFQALFFSSVVIFFGFGAIYVAYYYDFLERETRNMCFKATLSLAISWFTFSFCRSFERFFRDWLWIAVSVSLAHILDKYLNPMCRNEVVVATMVISQAIRLLIPRIVKFEFINKLVSSALPRLQNASTKLRIPLPYQIYEHHSLRHLVDPAEITCTDPNSPLLLTTETDSDDLSMRNSHNTMRRSSSSRASLTHSNEKQMSHKPSQKQALQKQPQQLQPLVDYIDEVMEGSICPDEDDSVDDFQLEDEGEGEDEEEDSGEEDADGAGAFDDEGQEGELDPADAEPAQGEGCAEQSRAWSPSSRALEQSPRTLNTSISEALNRLVYSINSFGSGKPLVLPAKETPAAPLWARLQSQHKGQAGHPFTAHQASRMADANANANATVQDKNRAALLEHTGISLADFPSFSIPAALSHHSSVPAGAGSVVTSQVSAQLTSTRRSTRRGAGKNVNAAVPPETADAANSANQDARTAPTSGGLAPLWGQLVGAVVTPLHLVGPIAVQTLGTALNAATTSDNIMSAAGGSPAKRRHTNRSTKVKASKAPVPNLAAPTASVWFPIATHDSAMVNDLQSTCDSLSAPGRCSIEAPLQDTVVFSATLRFGAHQDDVSRSDALLWVQRLNQNKADLHALCGRGLTTHMTAATLNQASPEDLSLSCVPQGSNVVLQLSLRIAGVLCSVLALVDTGKAALRCILNQLKGAHPSVMYDSVIKVNHLPLTSIERVLPCAHYISVQCSMQLSSAADVALLINSHQTCDRLEANAYIVDALRAQLQAVGVNARYAELAAYLEVDIQKEGGSENCVTVRGRVPLILAHYELLATAAGDNTRNDATAKCLALLTGASDGSSDSLSESLSCVLGSFVMIAYVSFLRNCQQ